MHFTINGADIYMCRAWVWVCPRHVPHPAVTGSGGTPSLNLSAQMLIEQSYGKKIRLINYTEGLVGAGKCRYIFIRP